MARLLRYLLLLAFTVISSEVWAQNGGIKGTIVDEKNQPLINATIQVISGGIVRGGTVTDFDGNYLVKPLAAGSYDVKISYLGYVTELVQGVDVIGDQTATVNKKLSRPQTGSSKTEIKEVVVRTTRYVKPLIEPTQPGDRSVLTAQDIEKMPVRDLASQVATTAGVQKSGRGDDLNLSGGRSENTLIIIDGIQQPAGSRASNLPPGSVGSVSVYTGGLPARYGDATGGVINVTTKGVTAKLQGSVGGEQSVEGYGNSRAYFNLSGPLLTRKDSSGNKRPVVGFTLNGDITYNQDGSPTYYQNYVVRQEVLDQIRANPLRAVPGVTGAPTYRPSVEFVTKSDLELQRRRINAENKSGTLLGKLDFQVAENMNLTVGGQFTAGSATNYSRAQSLFAPESMGTENSYTGRGYLRFTQRFANKASDRDNAISNAFYTVQADYQKEFTSREDPNFKRDIFKYGYLGKFTETRTPFYAPGRDSMTGRSMIALRPEVFTSNVKFERSDLNPILANYTGTLFNLGIAPNSIVDIRNFNGLLNGDFPSYAYSDRWTNVGSPLTGFSRANNDQISLGIDASFDLKPGKTRHAIEFGLYYQQRTERFYGLSSTLSGTSGGTNSLWQRARLLANSHFLNNIDSANATYLINGGRYTYDQLKAAGIIPGALDTVIYGLRSNGAQTAFDANLRQRLGLGADNKDYINVDALDPNQLSIDLFSPDELFNNGQPFVSYYGYDYAGNLQTGNVNWNDFWTKKDQNGRFTRPIGAFRPNYIAGYIQDNFEISKVNFNVGLRVDRYDANTKVLKDPYSLYQTYTVGNNPGAKLPGNAAIPSGIGSDYVIYVANNTAKNPTIIGFRNGDNWYDASGTYIEDPTTLKTATGGTDPQPYLVKNNLAGDKVVNIQDASYDPNSSFTDYKPQVNVMPRVSFSFPIQDQTLFYAHYDVVVQRPRSFVAPNPLDYYFMAQQTSAPIINNPDLKPEKLIDYEVGFQQAITRQSAITLSLFYKERRDQIQIRPYLYAFPQTYYTFGNRDFSTTKGLRVKYDFRRQGPIQFNLAYTLQFAEGTGSSAASGNRGRTDYYQTNGLTSNYISASLPNIRQTFALSYDARHNISLNLDYRYFANEGPMIGGRRLFQNAGVNLIANALSGTPYTRYMDPVSQTIIGGVNGARLPWRFNLDLAIDKDFALVGFGRKTADQTGLSGKRAPLVLNAFVNFRNLLNTRQILNVYGYSQDARDNGYLTSPQGQQAIPAQTNAASYIDLYSISVDNPNNFNLPRRIVLGFRVNF